MAKAEAARPWTPRAIAAHARALRLDLWRAVEAQHEASTMPLVDSLDEQLVLERLIDDVKPAVPPAARRLNYLLFTPFRYPPPLGGSRFRAVDDPGVFYGADAVRTACAELGYWRWRHLLDSPALAAMPQKAQTVFKARVATRGVDLRLRPFVRDEADWTDAGDYRACQRFARAAREAGIGAIRYRSVRDPGHGACGAVMTPAAFARVSPLEQQTWMLSVFRERVVWQRTHIVSAQTFEFVAADWAAAPAPAPAPARGRAKP
jgi:hypothetical protein